MGNNLEGKVNHMEKNISKGTNQVPACHPSTWEVETRGCWVVGQFRVRSETTTGQTDENMQFLCIVPQGSGNILEEMAETLKDSETRAMCWEMLSWAWSGCCPQGLTTAMVLCAQEQVNQVNQQCSRQLGLDEVDYNKAKTKLNKAKQSRTKQRRHERGREIRWEEGE